MDETTVAEQSVTYVPDADEPADGHCPRGRVIPGGDMLIALCGARLIGIEMPPDHPRCKICEAEFERLVY